MSEMLWNHLAVDVQPSKANHERRSRMCRNIAATVWIYFDFIMTLPRLGSLRLKKEVGCHVLRAKPFFGPARCSLSIANQSREFLPSPTTSQPLQSLLHHPDPRAIVALALGITLRQVYIFSTPLLQLSALYFNCESSRASLQH
jgi:hypothetical protein